MKTWKILGITVFMLISGLFWSGAADARRFNNHPYNSGYQSRMHNPHYGYHQNPAWSGGRHRVKGHDRHWQRGHYRQHNWNRYQTRTARHWW